MVIDLRSYAQEVDRYNEQRDLLIKASRDVLRSAKQFISVLHRGDDARQHLQTLEETKRAMDAIASKEDGLSDEGACREANQEYVEAVVFHGLLSARQLAPKPETVSVVDYLMGLCDVCGEISRHVVHLAIAGKKDEIVFFHEVVESLHREFLQFHMRGGHLRQKYDSIKYHLKTIEGVMYDMALKR